MKQIIGAFVLLWISWESVSANVNDFPVSIQTNPAAHLIQPDRDLVKTTITLPPNSEYEIILRTPPSHSWVSTDFPLVENTQLYHFQGVTQTGEVRFETIYPIQGEYPIEVKVNGSKHSLALRVNETPAEIWSMLVFLGVIFLIGIAGGQIFLKSSHAKSALATWAVMIGFSLILGENLAYAHDEKGQKQPGIVHWEQKQDHYSIEVHFDATQAVVGQNVEFDIQIKKDGTLLQESVTVEIETFHLEDETVMFKGAFTSKTGLMQQTLHFFDGAETKTTFTLKALPTGALSTGGVIDVAGVAPPFKVKMKTMALLTLVVLGGMAVGFFLIPRRKMIGEAI